MEKYVVGEIREAVRHLALSTILTEDKILYQFVVQVEAINKTFNNYRGRGNKKEFKWLDGVEKNARLVV